MSKEVAQAFYDPQVGETANYVTPQDAKDAINVIYTDMAAGVADKVAKAGDTMSGDLTINKAAAKIEATGTGQVFSVAKSTTDIAAILVKTPAAKTASVNFSTGDSIRWFVGKNSEAESGSNAGSNLSVYRYSDAGALIDAPISISRSTGKVTLNGDPVLDNHAATKNYVDAVVAVAAGTVSPNFTGIPTAPTAAQDTNTTQLATTAFVINQAGASNPVMNSTAVVGTSKRYSREDHSHPSDTTKAPLASPALTGTPTAPTAVVNTNTTQLATTAFVLGQAGSSNPLVNNTVAVGTSTRFAREDHVHPIDTTRAPLTGEGTSGTWPIAITGNAATATKLATARSIALTGEVTGSVNFDGSANVSLATTVVSAPKLTTARSISLTGDVSGSVTFDGSANVSITTTVADNSHVHASVASATNADTVDGRHVWTGTQASYDAIATKSSTTIYVVT